MYLEVRVRKVEKPFVAHLGCLPFDEAIPPVTGVLHKMPDWQKELLPDAYVLVCKACRRSDGSEPIPMLSRERDPRKRFAGCGRGVRKENP